MQLRKRADKTGKPPAEGEAWPISHVEILHAGPVQRFSPQFLQNGQAEGWVGISKGKITIDAKPDPVVYQIKRAPGVYCCHCGQRLPAGAAQDQSGQFLPPPHVAEKHKGAVSPDPENPSGYRQENYYTCTKEGATEAEVKATLEREAKLKQGAMEKMKKEAV